MIKRILVLMAITFTFLNANEDILVYKIDNKNQSITAQTIADGFTISGYTVAKNQDMNGPYKTQFGDSVFDIYNLMSIYHPDFAQKIVLKHSDAGIFVPFSIVVYQRTNDDTLYLALLSAAAQERIINVKDALFKDLETLNIKTIKEILPQVKTSPLDYKTTKVDSKLYAKYVFEVDDEDAEDSYNDMMMLMEGSMKMGGFVVANYLDFNKVLNEKGVKDYDFFHSYSLCKLKIIYELSKKYPEAGAFAPCTMVIHHKSGSNQTELVSLNIDSLVSMLSLKDKALLEMLETTQQGMVSIIEESSE